MIKPLVFSLSPTRIGEPAVRTRSRAAFAPSGAFLHSRFGHERAQIGCAPNTHEAPVIHSLGSEANGEASGLPTPGRFAGLENREVVVAKPCTFLFDRSSIENGRSCFENNEKIFARVLADEFVSITKKV